MRQIQRSPVRRMLALDTPLRDLVNELIFRIHESLLEDGHLPIVWYPPQTASALIEFCYAIVVSLIREKFALYV